MTRTPLLRRDRIGTAVSFALALMAHEAAMAQTPAAPAAASAPAAQPAEATKPKAPVNELETVLVVGTRQSQQSAISRKKNAATVQDSIVAEDVGAFPDRNIGEAISRIAGVALDRGDYGEGVNVTIRGNGPESTRVEMDGVGVSSGAGTNLLGGGDGRGTEFRELSSDLIKSVDIVKGSTASMTQGSLGASIIIETRNGLDFDKPYYSFRLAASKSDLAKKTTPDANLIWTDKFFDKKLGVMVNLNRASTVRENHSISQGGSNGQQGLVRLADFDNSPEKTFSYANSLAALLPSAADVPVSQWATSTLVNGVATAGMFNSLTPKEILQKSAAAQTKADCLTAFPLYTTAQLAPITTSGNRTLAYQSRVNEQLSCLNQWNDYTPSHTVGPRYNFRSNDDSRTSGDIRLDYKVNDQLAIYGKWIHSRRHVDDIVGFLSMGGAPVFNGAGTFTDNVATNTRTLTTGASGSALPGTYAFRVNNQPLIQGATTNIQPGYTVDSTHHVTSYSTDGNFLGTDTIFSSIDTTNKTLQGGGEYRNDRLRAKFMASYNQGTGLRYDRRASFSSLYGVGNFNLEPNGLWNFTRPGGAAIDQLGNLAGYATLNPAVASTAVNIDNLNPVFTPAYTAAQRARYTNNTQLNVIRAFDNENTEKQLKLDLTYNTLDKLPFVTALKSGFQLIDYRSTSWSGGGGELVAPVGTAGQTGFKPGVYAPSVTGRWNVIGCEDTTGSLATGGQPCAFGAVKNPRYDAGVGATVGGTTTLTTAQFQDLVRQTMTVAPASQFYGGAKDRPATLLNGWNQIDIDKLYQLVGFNVPLNCFRTCTASDGKVYDMPKSRLKDKQTAGYLQTDFEVDRLPFTDRPLPFGLELAGNIGVRVVRTDMASTGFMIFKSIRKNANWVEANGDTTNVTTAQVSQNIDFKGSRTDVSPSLNLALWPVPDKLVTRYSWSKQIARLPLSRVSPVADGAVTCTLSEIIEDRPPEDDGTQADQGCNRILGNPAMKPQTTISQNLSLEWYVNRDTSLSVSTFVQRDLVGAPNLRVGRSDVHLFEGSNAVDPLTGTPLRDLEFSFAQWDNTTPSKRRGVEFSSKTAFTFLPSVLRYTGFDANYSRLRNAGGAPMIDQISGEILPMAGQPKYSYNAAFWYDDGALQFRVAQQVVAARYQTYSPATNTNVGIGNFPSESVSGVRVPYNPGAPIFGKRTAFVDAKVSYRFKSGIELFADVRNLTGERNQSSTGGYQNYEGGIPSIYTDSYYGRTYMVGLTYRSPR